MQVIIHKAAKKTFLRRNAAVFLGWGGGGQLRNYFTDENHTEQDNSIPTCSKHWQWGLWFIHERLHVLSGSIKSRRVTET